MSTETKIAIITGAAGGIGRALCEVFVADGYQVAAVDLAGTGVEDFAQSLGKEHAGFACNLASETDIIATVAKIAAHFGRIDVLVNNAAIGPTMAATADTSIDGFRLALSVNLVGPLVLAGEVAERMGPEGGVIVNTASLAGVVSNPKRNAYAASKAGVVSMTKSLACELAPRNIRVVAIAPGYVRTPMVAGLERDGKADLSKVRQRIPMGRMARPAEIATVARFLASDKARYITGTVVAVDGGWATFNQPGEAHPPVAGTPDAELAAPTPRSGPRIVVVTGGARGIGRAICEAFAAKGDTVVILDREGDEAASVAANLGPQHRAITTDLAIEAEIVAAFAEIAKTFGRVDVLVNNAAIADRFMPVGEQTADYLTSVLDINLTGAFIALQQALALMPKPGGVILNLGSINTLLPFAPRHAYGASKAGIDMLTRCIAAELGPVGIRTATIAPGYIRTPGVAALEQDGKIDGMKIRRRIPMGDLGRPDDIADAALFLASEEASYMTGAILYVDGGWTAFGNAGDASSPELNDLERAE
ncbi:glucose 1-dehydrogenase [Rhizobium sp. C4]|uniref:glucose 1-dehydrogenase n=1 Tax=Rhizobium sp. C4 TaxID=1349800 RepID=UPI001E644C70|nr:glucose 1-dehydrogenase [Rhizobium sp. C4]MCD2172541.1 glucose 1-dehydrogenase [Rhizobium sp. C4]